jgi:hypothetical protein
MKLRTVVRDCLFLNWALPADTLPEPPAPLRYQRHAWQGRDYVFVSALLFHHDAVRWSALPLLRVGYPQLTLRLYVLDEDGMPAILFVRELMPAWMAPGVRLMSRHPASSARLDFPRPTRDAGADSWTWRAERGDTLSVKAWVHSPTFGEGPRLGSWEDTVRYIQERPRGYALHGGALHRVDASHPPVEAVWPLAADLVGADALLRRLVPLQLGRGLGAELARAPRDGHGPGEPVGTGSIRADEGASAAAVLAGTAAGGVAVADAAAPGSAGAGSDGFSWPALHSSWLCPEMPFSIVFDLVPKVHPVVQHLPHPAAGRISSPALSTGGEAPGASTAGGRATQVLPGAPAAGAAAAVSATAAVSAAVGSAASAVSSANAASSANVASAADVASSAAAEAAAVAAPAAPAAPAAAARPAAPAPSRAPGVRPVAAVLASAA